MVRLSAPGMHACMCQLQAGRHVSSCCLLVHSHIISLMHSMSRLQSIDTTTVTQASVYDLASARNIDCFVWLQHLMAVLKQW